MARAIGMAFVALMVPAVLQAADEKPILSYVLSKTRVWAGRRYLSPLMSLATTWSAAKP